MCVRLLSSEIVDFKMHNRMIFVCSSSLMVTDQPSPSQYEDVDYETEHAQRQKRLVFSDPVHSISLKDTLQSQVRIFHEYVLEFWGQLFKD